MSKSRVTKSQVHHCMACRKRVEKNPKSESDLLMFRRGKPYHNRCLPQRE